jgi:hypothetical protein
MDEVASRLEAMEHEARDRGPLILHGQMPLVVGDAVSDGMSATLGPEVEVVQPGGQHPSPVQPALPRVSAQLPVHHPPPRRQSLDALPLLSAMRPRGAAWQGAVSPAAEPAEPAIPPEPAELAPPVGLARPSRSFDLEMVAPPSQPNALPAAVGVRVPRWLIVGAAGIVVLLLALILRSTAARRAVEPTSSARATSPTASPASPVPAPAQPATGGAVTAGPASGTTGDPGAAAAGDKLDGDAAAGKRKRRDGKRAKLKKQDGDPMAVFREQ